MTISQEIGQLESEMGASLGCCHYWVIEAANGPVSRGVCRNCLESRQFRNSVVDNEKEPPDLPLVLESVAGGTAESAEA